jgi:transposase-like protein
MPEFKPVALPQIAAIERPDCPKCRQHRMLLSKLNAGPSGFGTRTFECQRCGHSTTVVSEDPMTSDARGWLASELRPPT